LWQGASAFLMHLRRYTKPGYLTVTVDPQAGLFRIAQEGDLPHPIAGMQATLEAAFDRFGMAAAEAAPTAAPERRRRRLALALGGGMGLLAALGLVAWLVQPDDRQGLLEPPAAQAVFAER
jgi:hypothetical protein